MLRTKGLLFAIGSSALFSLLFVFQNCSNVNFVSGVEGTTSAASTSPPPDTDKTSYAWVTNGYGACSVSCGGGTQTQSVYCQRNDGVTVDDGFCTSTKPSTTQICNIDACEVDHWVTSGFGACSVSCGGGIQTQTVLCQNQNNQTVDNSRCSQPAPVTSQSCNTQACVTYTWEQSGFGTCSAACGGGTQTQSVICQDSTGKMVADSFCSGTKPATSQVCNPQACLTYNWTQSGFGACSATCGGGTQTQTVLCKDNLGHTVDNSLCTGVMPATTQTCSTQACVTYSWKQLGWSACSAACGGGTQTQSVICQDSNGNTVDNAYCASIPMPATSQACNTQACKPNCNAAIARASYCPINGTYCGATCTGETTACTVTGTQCINMSGTCNVYCSNLPGL